MSLWPDKPDSEAQTERFFENIARSYPKGHANLNNKQDYSSSELKVYYYF